MQIFSAVLFLLLAQLLVPSCTNAFSLSGAPINAPQCCAPKQFETKYAYTTIGGQPLTNGLASFSYDFTNQLSAWNYSQTSADGRSASHQILWDGRRQREYNLDLQTGRCTVGSAGSVGLICVPAFMSLQGTIALGDAYQRFNANIFGDSSAGVSYSLVASQGNCALVSYAVSQNSPSHFSIQNYYNFTLGIKDPRVFAIPRGCASEDAEMMMMQPEPKEHHDWILDLPGW